MATVIAKNVAGGELEVGDLGIILGPAEQIILTDTFETTEIISSLDLRNYVQAGDIVINNGSSDLSIEDGLSHISIQTEFEDLDQDDSIDRNLEGGSAEASYLPEQNYNGGGASG